MSSKNEDTAPKDISEVHADADDKVQAAPSATADMGLVKAVIAFCGVVTVVALAAAIALGVKAADNNKTTVSSASAAPPTIIINTGDRIFGTDKPPAGTNPCEGKKPDLPNVACVVDALTNVGPQSGANVTQGYTGGLDVDHVPITTPYWMNGMCPVNVHWHLGAEHYSLGQYDETGTGPVVPPINRRSLAEGARQGFQCKYYNASDVKFTKPYVWKHCVGMEVGQTYEVHWPHSAAGACGTLDQYQTPFYDGVFCRDNVLNDTAKQVGVQAQIFTIVNDETYYYPDLMRGMIVDAESGMGQDIAKYTGSTTGTTRDNEICSQYSPITWQVDRKCHLVSASTFDKMCADMKAQRDDMSDDLYAHGSRELVADELAANNHQRRRLLRAA